MKTVKRVLTMLLAVCLLTACLPMSASAATNPYKSTQTINNITTMRCTYVAWKFAYEKAGVALPGWGGNAKAWYSNAKSEGYKMYGPDEIPPAQSIMCWNGEYGHVAYVVSADSNGATIIENSGSTWHEVTKPWSSLKTRGAGSADGKLTLQGCFALKGDNITVTTGSATNISATSATLSGSFNSTFTIDSIGINIGTSLSNMPWLWSKKVSGKSSSFSLDVSTVKSLQPKTKYYYQVYAAVDGTIYWGDIKEFTTSADVSVTTKSASSIAGTSAVLSGTIKVKNGNTTSVGIQMGTSKSNTPHLMGKNVSSSDYTLTYTASNLKPNTTYYYRVYGYVDGEFYFGDYKSFKTAAYDITVTPKTKAATSVTSNSAVLNGTIKVTNGKTSTVGIQMGTSKSDTPLLMSKNVSSSDYTLSYTASKLKPNTTYYYRVYGYVNDEFYFGDYVSFKTAAADTPLVFKSSDSYNIPAGVVGVPIKDIDVSKGVSGGTKPYTFSCKQSPTLPAGISVSSSTGVISGTPSKACNAGNAKIVVTDKAGNTASITISYGAITEPEDNIYHLSYYYYSGSSKNGYEEKESETKPCRFIVRESEENRAGYIFKGWSWTKNSTIPEYFPGDIVEIEENRTLYAVWESDGSVSFVDVTVGAYYYNAVDWAVENKITSGTSDTTFSPDDSCTRAQAVTFLWRAAGSPTPSSQSSFKDVNSGEYYSKAVSWAVEQGITSGTGGGKFSPNDKCSRAQIVTFLYRAEGSPSSGGSSFNDVSGNAYYAKAVSWAVGRNITSGTGNGKFSPDDNCTRGQIVTFLYRDMK